MLSYDIIISDDDEGAKRQEELVAVIRGRLDKLQDEIYAEVERFLSTLKGMNCR